MIKLFIVFILSFVLSLILLPVLIRLLKHKKANQTILGYVENHKDKNGTTTMGGVVFIIVTLVLAFAMLEINTTWLICVLVSVFFGILGFMDDFMKIKYKQNLGLRPYQKVVGQLGLAIILAIYIAFFSNIGGGVYIPFTEKSFNLKFLIIPLIVLVMIATSNSVNLTDGLDGLAGNVTIIYLVFFIAITSIFANKLYLNGETGEILTNIKNLNIISSIIIGSVLAFLLFNTHKASIFMGDVGSLFLGGYIGASACIVGFELLLPILAFCFLFSAVSVILQVAVFKIKKKRVFKMAPFHHHLQMSGISEPKVVFIYNVITTIIGSLCVILYML